MFQHYALFRHMTVFENIAFGLRVRPRKLRLPERELRAKVNELLDLIQLVPLVDPLSVAAFRRTAAAGGSGPRAGHRTRACCCSTSRSARSTPRCARSCAAGCAPCTQRIPVTSVLVTHDQEEALEVADRIVIMNKGRIEQTGTPDEVFHHPASEFVVTFLGNVNLFQGRADSGGQAARVFVRPHELDIERHPQSGNAVAARIVRIQSAGPVVRVELSRAESPDQNGDDSAINVELTHDQYRALELKSGEAVFVKVRDARVFAAGR